MAAISYQIKFMIIFRFFYLYNFFICTITMFFYLKEKIENLGVAMISKKQTHVFVISEDVSQCMLFIFSPMRLTIGAQALTAV